MRRSAGRWPEPHGRRTVNVLPLPGSLSTWILPRCCLTSSLTSDSPMPTAFLAAALDALNTVETLEQVHLRLSRDADAGITDFEFDVLGCAREPHANRAVQRVLEGVRDQIEDDLFPHVAIDPDRSRQVLALHHELEACPVGGRAEHAHQIARQRGQISGSKRACRRPASIREKSSRVFTSFSRRRALRCATSSSPRSAGDPRRGRQCLLQRTQQQRQRRAEFVADVGEEYRLGAIDFGQFLGAAPLTSYAWASATAAATWPPTSAMKER